MIYIDADTGKAYSSLTLLTPIPLTVVGLGDTYSLECQFFRDGVIVELDSSAVGELGLSRVVDGDLTTTSLAFVTSWTKTGSGTSTVYTFALDFSGGTLSSIFEASGDVEMVFGRSDVKWTIYTPAPTTVQRSRSFDWRIDRSTVPPIPAIEEITNDELRVICPDGTVRRTLLSDL